ncbi:hypothetical protein TNCV_1848891 [Trichonephila clavipes]|nr:hypothetical protein TNCV_1848891 [Trichonephila clavipes]
MIFAKCDESVCEISFTYRVKSRGELRLPCGRPLLIGRGEERILSTLTLNYLWEKTMQLAPNSKTKTIAGEKQLYSAGEKTTQLYSAGEKTTQLASAGTKQLNSSAGTKQLNSSVGTKQLNSSAGTKQLNSALPSTACNRLYSRIGFFYLLMFLFATNPTMCKEMGSGLIHPFSIWFWNWLCDATWWMEVNGVSVEMTNRLALADWRTEATKWMLGVSIK